jgi:hypothetical protein
MKVGFIGLGRMGSVTPTRRRVTRTVGTVALLGVLSGGAAVASAGERCDARLKVTLPSDVPNTGDAGFLSSLLNDPTTYHLELLRQAEASVVELDLSGPGSESRSASVIETMRKDARVESIRVDSTQMLPSAIAPEPLSSGQSSEVQLSESGLGALSWALQHPQQAWRVLLPIGANEAVTNGALRESDPPNPPDGT